MRKNTLNLVFRFLLLAIIGAWIFLLRLDDGKTTEDFRSQKYMEMEEDYGFDIDGINFLSPSFRLGNSDILKIWELVDRSNVIEPYHVYARVLGIIWRKKTNGLLNGTFCTMINRRYNFDQSK